MNVHYANVARHRYIYSFFPLFLDLFNNALRNAILFYGVLMRDKNDLITLDAFHVPRVGRPITSSPDKKKKDAADRARRFRLSKKTPVLTDDIHTALFCVIQKLNWMENEFFADGTFFAAHSPEACKLQRSHMARDLIRLCNALGATDLIRDLEYLVIPVS